MLRIKTSSVLPTIVFCHGMWEKRENLKRWHQSFEERGYPVEAIELDRTNISQRRFIDDHNQFKRFVTDIDADEIIPIGHSKGGLLVQSLPEDPRIVMRILVASAAPKGIFPIDNFTQVISLLAQLDQFFSRTARPTSYWAKKIVTNTNPSQGWDVENCPPESLRTFHEVFWGISVPKGKNVHVVAGAEDLLIPLRVQREIADYHNALTDTTFYGDHFSLCQSAQVAEHLVYLVKTYGSSCRSSFSSVLTLPEITSKK